MDINEREYVSHKTMEIRSGMTNEEKVNIDKAIQKTMEGLKWSETIKEHPMCYHCRQQEHKDCFHIESLPCNCPVCHPKNMQSPQSGIVEAKDKPFRAV